MNQTSKVEWVWSDCKCTVLTGSRTSILLFYSPLYPHVLSQFKIFWNPREWQFKKTWLDFGNLLELRLKIQAIQTFYTYLPFYLRSVLFPYYFLYIYTFISLVTRKLRKLFFFLLTKPMYLLVQTGIPTLNSNFCHNAKELFFGFRHIQSSTGPCLITPQPATDQILWTTVTDKWEINQLAVQKLIYSFYAVMDQNLLYKIDFKTLVS